MPQKLPQTVSQRAAWGRAQCKSTIPVLPLSPVCSLISNPSLCQQPLGQPNTGNRERKNIQGSQKIILSPIPFIPICKVHKSFIYLSSLVLSIEQFYLFICLIIYLFLSFQIILRRALHQMTPPQWHMRVTWGRGGAQPQLTQHPRVTEKRRVKESCPGITHNLRPFSLRVSSTCPNLGTRGEHGVGKNVSRRRRMTENHFPGSLKRE